MSEEELRDWGRAWGLFTVFFSGPALFGGLELLSELPGALWYLDWRVYVTGSGLLLLAMMAALGRRKLSELKQAGVKPHPLLSSALLYGGVPFPFFFFLIAACNGIRHGTKGIA